MSNNNNNTELPWWAVLLIIIAALITAKYLFRLDRLYFFASWLGANGGIKY